VGVGLDKPDTYTYTHRAGMTWLGQVDVSHPSMGFGWHAQIGTGLGMRVLGAQESVQGVPWATTMDGSR